MGPPCFEHSLHRAINKGLDRDERTCWDSLYEIVEIFFEQQQQSFQFQLMIGRNSTSCLKITVLEAIKEVLSSVSTFTRMPLVVKNAPFSPRSHLLSCRIFSTLTVQERDSNLKCELKENIGGDLRQRYEDGYLQLHFSTPRFEDSFCYLQRGG